MTSPPAAHVLDGFGLRGEPALVLGGQGTTYRVDGVALKPCEEPAEAEWLGGILSRIEEDGFRTARPIRSASGRFVVGRWCAFRWVAGEASLSGRRDEAIGAIRAFYRALRDVPQPEVLDRRTNVFAVADRAAWGELARDRVGDLGPDGDRFLRLLRPVATPAQLIHGDPSEGNLLFADGLPPAVIDVAPYWHPAEYAVAMFLADAIAWSGASPDLLENVRDVPEMPQLLARAVLFRLMVAKLWRGGDAGVAMRSKAYAPLIDTVEGWVQ